VVVAGNAQTFVEISKSYHSGIVECRCLDNFFNTFFVLF
jgi:hypothetical protein